MRPNDAGIIVSACTGCLRLSVRQPSRSEQTMSWPKIGGLISRRYSLAQYSTDSWLGLCDMPVKPAKLVRRVLGSLPASGKPRPLRVWRDVFVEAQTPIGLSLIL